MRVIAQKSNTGVEPLSTPTDQSHDSKIKYGGRGLCDRPAILAKVTLTNNAQHGTYPRKFKSGLIRR